MKKSIYLALIVSVVISLTTYSQQVDINKLIGETQISNSGTGEVSIAWWIPVEFWETVFKQEEAMTPAQIEETMEILKPFVLFAIVDGKVGPFGGLSYTPVDSIKSTLVLQDSDQNVYRSCNIDTLSGDIQNLVAAFKPILKNMMGQLGENMNFFVFSDIKNENERVADPYKEGYVHLSYIDNEVKWRTPLGSLMPPKICPKCDEEMDGSWKYCPWHGVRLKEID